MARVVTRRTSPPYLLIILAFLFVIAATLAVLWRVDNDDLRDAKAQEVAVRSKLASDSDLNNPRVQKMMRDFEDKPNRGTVVKQLFAEIDRLTKAVTGTITTAQDAYEKAEKLFQKTGETTGLIAQVEVRQEKVGELTKQLTAANDALGQKDSVIGEKDRKIAELAASHKQALDAANLKYQEQVAKFDALQKAHEQQMAEARTDWEQKRKEKEEQIANQTEKIEGLQLEVQKKDITIAKLQTQIREITKRTVEVNVALQPDGRIIKILEGEDVCYIDIGRKDGVMMGLAFAVYPPSGIPESGQGKGILEVTAVSDNTSECRVVKVEPDKTLVASDLIANLAFSSMRALTFVVEGQFDLYGAGRASEMGKKEVAALIQRYGGKVAGEITIDTDFVVMGVEPPRPNKPKETDPPQVHAAYREQMKVFDHYQNIRRLAQSYNVPVLNTNRFLAFMGYAPTQTLTP